MADFTNIDGVYVKDTELRSGIDTLRTTVLSNTIKPLTVTKNGTYTAIPSSGTYGYSPITVDVQEEPWQPLEDGYSNFWFELTNDTLRPWLKFSAKNNNATIDWGDGTGEQPLDTLTPIHTYAKAGRYVVKVKGVTGITKQFNVNATEYYNVLRYVELNNEVDIILQNGFSNLLQLKAVDMRYTTTTQGYVFQYCGALKNVRCDSMTETGNGFFSNTLSLSSVTFNDDLNAIKNDFFCANLSLSSLTIPTAVQSIGNSAFLYCSALKEIHCKPTTPPTLGTNVFISLPVDWVCYVPVGYGDTYKAASGWSTYADHIVEEGQSLSMAALRRIQAEKNDTTDNDEMR